MKNKDLAGKLMPTFLMGAVVSLGGGAFCSIAWQNGHESFMLDVLGYAFAISIVGCFLGWIGSFIYDVWDDD